MGDTVRFVLMLFMTCGAALAADPVLLDGQKAPDYAFLQWKEAFKAEEGGIRIRAAKGEGGGGYHLAKKLDLAAFGEWSPAVRITAGPAHKMQRLRIVIGDADKSSHEFVFDLSGLKAGESALIVAENAASLAQAKPKAAGDKPGLDLVNINMVQVQGDWSAAVVDLLVREVVLVKPDDQMRAAREAQAKKLAAAEEKVRREREARAQLKAEMLARPSHPADGPDVVDIGAVAADIIALVLQEQTVPRGAQVPYEKRDGDVLKPVGEPRPVWENGVIVERPLGIKLERGKGKEKISGHLAPAAGMFKPDERVLGQALTDVTIDEPAAYRIGVDGAEAQPARVFWKRKPNQFQARGHEVTVFLKLALPMVEGKRYRVKLVGINTAQETVDFDYAPRNASSLAVHASQIGYRADDPFKRGALSVWLGTGGAHSYADGTPFHVLEDATGQAVFSGKSKLLKTARDAESFRSGRNYGKTDVHALDFGALNKPGKYRLYVEGIGCSYPFEIATGVWERAFGTSMLGLLHHRCGVELGPPFTSYKRPRNMHPADGFRVIQIERTMLDGESDAVRESVKKLIGKRDTDLGMQKEAWGGYHDAGDWDRRSLHLSVTNLLIELYDLYPEYFGKLKLSLPPVEQSNNLPDVLDEALWNLSFYKRLQLADGGVRGGVESTAHPRPGEASWQETLVVGVFAPDHVSSYHFAGSAARFARVVEKLDAKLAAEYREAALRAWTWAEANGPKVEAGLRERGGKQLKDATVRDAKNLAALELYALTGEAALHEAFLATSVLKEPNPEILRQQHAVFAYARLPEGKGDAQLKLAARKGILDGADAALKFADGNAWNIALDVPLPPMGFVGYFTVPGAVSRSLPRAYVLTGDERYLAGAIRSCQFGLGVNPDNLVYTTGLGVNPVRNPLHIDSHITGQPAPAGITVYGISDPAEDYGFDSWAYVWSLKEMTPPARTWPAAEMYWDIYHVPSTNEYTVHQTIGPTAYTWGVLAARKAR